MKLALAMNVKHHLHQVEAGRRMGFEIALWGPWYPSKQTLELLAALRLTNVSLTRRGKLPDCDSDVTRHGLGLAQFVPPALGRLGLPYSDALVRLVHAMESRACARAFRTSSVVHVVEGLMGQQPSKRDPQQKIVLERRNLHHEEFEGSSVGINGMPTRGSFLDPLRSQLTREYDAADKIVVYSQVARDSFLSRGYPPNKIAVVPIPFVPRAVAPAGQELPAAARTGLYVGRCVVDKGLDVAIEAVRRSAEIDKLIVVGSASKSVRSWMEGMAHVDYRGVLPFPDIAKLMRTCSIFLMPSIESYGLAVLEAVSLGLPVVVSDRTGVAEHLVKGDELSVVQNRLPDSWAERIDAVSSLSEAERERLVAAQHSSLDAVSWEASVNAQQAVYASLESIPR